MCECEIIEADGVLCCKLCGRFAESYVVFTTQPSYDSQRARSWPKNQYNRTKRFMAYMQQFGFANQDFETIVHIFSILNLEFQAHQKKRIYFFNKSVVLKYLCDLVGVVCNVTSLKDTSREETQRTAINALLFSETHPFPFPFDRPASQAACTP